MFGLKRQRLKFKVDATICWTIKTEIGREEKSEMVSCELEITRKTSAHILAMKFASDQFKTYSRKRLKDLSVSYRAYIPEKQIHRGKIIKQAGELVHRL